MDTGEDENMGESDADVILSALRPVIDGLVATFGPTCEVVLHDYRQGGQSVVAVAGSVTNRKVGGALSEIGLAVLAQGDAATNDINYATRTPGGRLIKSSTMPLRDSAGHVFGALCVNLDVTVLRQAGDLLSTLAGTAPPSGPATTFSDDFDDVVDVLVRVEEVARGKPVTAFSRAQRLDLIRTLDRRGVFSVRNAAQRIAERLGMSRSAVYADLNECRKTRPDPEEDR